MLLLGSALHTASILRMIFAMRRITVPVAFAVVMAVVLMLPLVLSLSLLLEHSRNTNI